MTTTTPPTSSPTETPTLGSAAEAKTPGAAGDVIWQGTHRPTIWHVVAVVALIVIGDAIFYTSVDLGWTAGAFAALLLIATVLLNPRLVHSKAGIVLTVLLLGLCLSFVESPTTLATTLLMFGLAALALADRPHISARFWTWAEASLMMLVQGFLRPLIDAGIALGSIKTIKLPSRGREIVSTWFFPVGLSLVFLLMFAAGNPIIAKWLEPLQWFEQINFQLPEEARIALWLVLGFACWIFLRAAPFFVPPERATKSTARTPDEVRVLPALTPETIIRAMVLFNAVFAIQNGLDLHYMWGGGKLPEGVTYASYVHSGTHPLIASALLAGAVVLLAFPSNATEKPSRWAYLLMYVWIAQNVFLILSAMQRMALYVDAYSLTYLRIAAVVWMGLVASGLVLIVLRIMLSKSSRWLVNANILALIVVAYVSCFVDFARYIADYNVANSRELGGRAVALDVKYLGRIGTSSLPALYKYHATLPVGSAKWKRTNRKIEQLEKQLLRRKSDWRAWTYRSDRLIREIKPNAAPKTPESTGRNSKKQDLATD
ncbi:MAG: DUF4173 domain-containing protein [Filomicrobium sp.]